MLNVLWEQEMYTPFSYFQLSKNFQYFPADVSFNKLTFNKLSVRLKKVFLINPNRSKNSWAGKNLYDRSFFR